MIITLIKKLANGIKPLFALLQVDDCELDFIPSTKKQAKEYASFLELENRRNETLSFMLHLKQKRMTAQLSAQTSPFDPEVPVIIMLAKRFHLKPLKGLTPALDEPDVTELNEGVCVLRIAPGAARARHDQAQRAPEG